MNATFAKFSAREWWGDGSRSVYDLQRAVPQLRQALAQYDAVTALDPVMAREEWDAVFADTVEETRAVLEQVMEALRTSSTRYEAFAGPKIEYRRYPPKSGPEKKSRPEQPRHRERPKTH